MSIISPVKKFIRMQRIFFSVKRHAFVWLVGTLLFLTWPGQNISARQFSASGTLLGYDRKPMRKADISLLSNADRFPREMIQRFHVQDDGTFRIEFDRPGLYRLLFSGVSHTPLSVPFYFEEEDSIIVSVRLSPLDYKDQPDTLYIHWGLLGHSKKFSFSKWMTPDPSGVYRATFQAYGSEFAYQIGGICKDDKLVSGFQADDFRLTGKRHYISVIKTPASSEFDTAKARPVSIEFDLSGLPKTVPPPHFRIISASRKAKSFFEVYSATNKRFKKYFDNTIPQDVEQKDMKKSGHKQSYDSNKELEELVELIQNEKDPFRKKLWLISLIDLDVIWSIDKDSLLKQEIATQALELISPCSPLWSFTPNGFLTVLSRASKIKQPMADQNEKANVFFVSEYGQPFLAYAEKAVECNQDKAIRPYLLQTMIRLAHRFNERELFDKYYSLYMKENAGSIGAMLLENYYAPASNITPGKPVPDFIFRLLDGDGREVSKASLHGKAYILHFWEPECSHCIETARIMQWLFTKYARHGLLIISIALPPVSDVSSDSLSTGSRMRETLDIESMPWHHVVLSDRVLQNKIMRDFNVVKPFYRYLLVDKDGNIRGTDTMPTEEFINSVKKAVSDKY